MSDQTPGFRVVIVCGGRPAELAILSQGHTVAVTAAGKVFVWGWNAFGQLGLGSVDMGIPSPTRLFALENPNAVVSMAAGQYNTLVATSRKVRAHARAPSPSALALASWAELRSKQWLVRRARFASFCVHDECLLFCVFPLSRWRCCCARISSYLPFRPPTARAAPGKPVFCLAAMARLAQEMVGNVLRS